MKEFDSRIIPECYADTLLIKFVGYESPNHQHSIGEVANLMVKKYAYKKVIGVIDNDKTKPSYFKDFQEIKSSHNLILKRKPNTEHYLIVVNPAFEKWIEYAGDLKKIKRPYPNNDREFRNSTKDFNVEKNNKITNYINAIKQSNSPAFLKLKEFIDGVLNEKK